VTREKKVDFLLKNKDKLKVVQCNKSYQESLDKERTYFLKKKTKNEIVIDKISFNSSRSNCSSPGRSADQHFLRISKIRECNLARCFHVSSFYNVILFVAFM
jgi:hypothetical protein